MTLKSPRFASDARLQAASNNSPAMRYGETGEPVRKVQQALIDLGFPLPASTNRTGAPDGIFGTETVGALQAFQRRESLAQDGIAGRQSLERMDVLLPGVAPPLPPPGASLVPYTVGGMKSRQRQPSPMSCWATCYAMLYGWRYGLSVPPRDSVVPLGQKWVDYYDADKGLPIHENRAFALATRLTAEPLMSLPPDSWALLLRQFGLLWLVHGWEVAGVNGTATRRGRHAIVIEGIAGDGSESNSGILYTDPADGRLHEIPFPAFVEEYELGFTIGNIFDPKRAGFSQILHY